MSAQILDGKVLAAKLKEDLSKEIASLKHPPRIVSIAFGRETASQSYISSQQKTAASLGVHYVLQVLDEHWPLPKVIDVIEKINADSLVHGIIVNKPVPASMDFYVLINAIAQGKDIEGMNMANLGALMMNKSLLWPCTPSAALELLKSSGISLAGKTAVIVGRSEIVGKPMALLLLKEHMTVTVCHSRTVDLKGHLKSADVVVAAIGKPLFIQGDWIKPGAAVIDIGINQHEGKIVGDVDFDSAKERAGYITPVPGGVGPVTSVMLMKNAVEACKGGS